MCVEFLAQSIHSMIIEQTLGGSLNPANLSAEALTLFNTLSPYGQQEACELVEEMPEEQAVYVAALRAMPKDKRRAFIFSLSKKRWGL